VSESLPLQRQQLEAEERIRRGYSVAEAARVLDRSERRIRQMIAEGKLSTVDGPGGTTLDREQVHTMRDRVKAQDSRPSARDNAIEEALRLMRQQAEAAERLAQRAIASDEKVEAYLREALARAEAEATQARADVAQLRERIIELETEKGKGKGWKRKDKRSK
jgi:hypothetical protein